MRHSGRETLFAPHGHFIWLAKLVGSECDYNRSKIISNCYLLNVFLCYLRMFVLKWRFQNLLACARALL